MPHQQGNRHPALSSNSSWTSLPASWSVNVGSGVGTPGLESGVGDEPAKAVLSGVKVNESSFGVGAQLVRNIDIPAMIHIILMIFTSLS